MNARHKPFADTVGIVKVMAQVLPEDKAEKIESLKKRRKNCRDGW